MKTFINVAALLSDMNKNKNYYENHSLLSLRAFLENDKGEVLIIRRSAIHKDGTPQNSPERWSLPGGLLKYTKSPDDGLTKIIKNKTGLAISDIDFIKYQNSPPTPDGRLHCLNMYFKAKAQGAVLIDSDNFLEFKWIIPSTLKNYDLAFRANDAIHFYEETKKPVEDLLWQLVNEAGALDIPVTKKSLIELQALPGFFKELEADLREYEKVRVQMNGYMQMIQIGNKRGHDSIIRQIQSRTKDYSSIVEKMIRKGQDGIPRHYTTFDDISGVRAVVPFLKDVYTVRDRLLEFDGLKLVGEEDFIKNPKPSGYRSLHLTLDVPLPGINFLPKCEVQIRTIAQQNISEGTHEIVYKNTDVPDEYKQKVVELWNKNAITDDILNNLRHDIEHLNDAK
jgi:ppGpp synthetase/RelA/SpoT-type nucleotidyltranferase